MMVGHDPVKPIINNEKINIQTTSNIVKIKVNQYLKFNCSQLKLLLDFLCNFWLYNNKNFEVTKMKHKKPET